PEPKGHVPQLVLRCFVVRLKRIDVVGEMAERLGSGTKALGVPHPVFLAVLEHPFQYLGCDWRSMERANSGERLDVMQCQGEVLRKTLGVGFDRITQQQMRR